MKILDTISAWRQARRTYNQLNNLSTRELDDMGINRGDIDRIARKQFNQGI